VSYLPAEILDYIETHAPPEESSTGISQAELSKALGYHRCSMSRPLAELLDEGLLRAQRGFVRGAIRKQLIYTLTEQGRNQLRRQSRDAPLLSGAIPAPPNPFLGRKPELHELEDFASGGGVLFVEGRAGMGKTALVSKLIRKIRSGRAPFWFTIRAGSSPSHFSTALSHALAYLGAQQLAYYSQLPRQPIGREVSDLVQRTLGDRGLLAIIDDVQAGTGDMGRFLADFVAGFKRDRTDCFVFVSQEPPLFEPRHLPFHRIVLGGLDRTAAHELTDRKGGLADRFEVVFEASQGSPLLLQLAVSSPETEPTSTALPAALVNRLRDEEVRGVIPLALANEALPQTFLLRATSIKPPRLTELVQMGLLQRSPDGRIDVLQVVREELLRRVRPAEERAGHLQVASYYSGSRRPEAVRERFVHLVAAEAWKLAQTIIQRQERILLSLGYSDTLRNALRHLSRGMPPGPGRVRALRAEATVLRMHSEYSEALLSLRRATIESVNDSKQQAECLAGTIELLVRLGQTEEAENALGEVEARSAGSRRIEVLAQIGRARITEANGDLREAQRLYERAFESAKRARLLDLSLESIQWWSRLATIGGERTAAMRMADEGLPAARQAGRLDIVFNLLLVRARAFGEIGLQNRAQEDLAQLRREAEASGYLNPLASAFSGLCAIAIESGRLSEAITFARQACDLAERLGNDIILGHTLALQCTAEHRQAGLPGTSEANYASLMEEARNHGHRSVSILSQLPPSDSLVFAHGFLADLYAELKRNDEARNHLDQALNLANSLGMTWWKDRIGAEVLSKLGPATEPTSKTSAVAENASGEAK
jgi:tetratricopeptide (TPR) repeat protein/DNA-binding transcriptional ArsR family regulator